MIDDAPRTGDGFTPPRRDGQWSTVTPELPEDKAIELANAIAAGAFKDYGIVRAEIIQKSPVLGYVEDAMRVSRGEMTQQEFNTKYSK